MMIALLESNTLANPESLSTLLALVPLKALIVLAAAFLSVAILRRSSAGLKHGAWSAAFLVLLVLPVMAAFLPSWDLRLPQSWTRQLSEWTEQGPRSSVITEPGPEGTVMASPTPEPMRARTRAAKRPRLSAAPISALGTVAASIGPGGIAAALWTIGFLFVIGRWAIGLAVVSRRRRLSLPVADPSLRAEVARLSARLGLSRPVEIRLGGSGEMPQTWGVFKPVVLLPQEAVDWSGEEREIVLLHELAHVRRLDVLIQHISVWACAIHWFNPLVWPAAGRLRLERERACDEVVLSAGARPSIYARQLLWMARNLRPASWTSLTSAAMARRNQLEGRLLAILSGRRRNRDRGWTLPAVAAGALLLATPLAVLAPRLLAAEAASPRHPAQQPQESPERGRTNANLTWTGDDDSRTRLDIKGVRLSSDLGEIRDIRPGGYFRFRQQRDGIESRLDIRPGKAGELDRTYTVEGRIRDWDSDADALLEDALSRYQVLHRSRPVVERVRQQAQEIRQEVQRFQEENGQELRELQERIRSQLEEQRIDLNSVHGLLESEMAQVREMLQESREQLRATSIGELAEAMEQIRESIRIEPLRLNLDSLKIQLETLRELDLEPLRVEIEGLGDLKVFDSLDHLDVLKDLHLNILEDFHLEPLNIRLDTLSQSLEGVMDLHLKPLKRQLKRIRTRAAGEMAEMITERIEGLKWGLDSDGLRDLKSRLFETTSEFVKRGSIQIENDELSYSGSADWIEERLGSVLPALLQELGLSLTDSQRNQLDGLAAELAAELSQYRSIEE